MTILLNVRQVLKGEAEAPANMAALLEVCKDDLTSDELETAKIGFPEAFAVLEQPVKEIKKEVVTSEGATDSGKKSSGDVGVVEQNKEEKTATSDVAEDKPIEIVDVPVESKTKKK